MDCLFPLPPVLTSLINGDFEGRWRALNRLLPEAQPAYLPPLTAACQGAPSDWELHWFTARLCGAWSGPESLATLMDLWAIAREPEAKGMILQAIARQGNVGLALLQQALGESHHQGLAITAIARSEQPKALALLLDLVESDSTALRAQILSVLGPLREAHILPYLRAALHDPEAQVRQAAILGLRQQPACTASERLDWLQPLLYDSQAEVAREASWAIAQLHCPEATAVLTRSLRSLSALAHPQVVIQALASLPDPCALEALATVLYPDADPTLARAAIRSLSSCPLQGAATLLLLNRLGQDEQELADLAYSLGQLGQPEAIAPLQASLAGANAAAAMHIDSALRRLRAQA